MGEFLKLRLAAKVPAKAPIFVVSCFSGEKPHTGAAPPEIAKTAAKAVDQSGWKATEGSETRSRSSSPDGPFVSVWGLGSRKKFGAAELCSWLEKAARQCGSPASFGCITP